MSRAEFGPIAPPVAKPVEIEPSSRFVVPPVVARAEAERIAREAIVTGVLRPADVDRATIAPTELAYVPLWSVQVSGSAMNLARGSFPIFGADANGRSQELILGRSGLPYDPSGSVKIEPGSIIPASTHDFGDGHLIEPDVSQRAAEREACDRLKKRLADEAQRAEEQRSRRQGDGGNTLGWLSVEGEVQSSLLCFFPIWLVRYHYVGEAAPGAASDEYFVGVSARTGKIACKRHPSAIRAVAGKVRRAWSKLFR